MSGVDILSEQPIGPSDRLPNLSVNLSWLHGGKIGFKFSLNLLMTPIMFILLNWKLSGVGM